MPFNWVNLEGLVNKNGSDLSDFQDLNTGKCGERGEGVPNLGNDFGLIN